MDCKYITMNSPKKISLNVGLDLQNLFKRSKFNNQSVQNKAKKQIENKSAVSQRITRPSTSFIPRCPYERSTSLNINRKRGQISIQNASFGVFSARITKNSLLFSSGCSINLTKSQNKDKSFEKKCNEVKKCQNPEADLKYDKFEISRALFDSQTQKNNEKQRKYKMRGLRVRTGSEVRKNKVKVELDCSKVSIQGRKFVLFSSK